MGATVAGLHDAWAAAGNDYIFSALVPLVFARNDLRKTPGVVVEMGVCRQPLVARDSAFQARVVRRSLKRRFCALEPRFGLSFFHKLSTAEEHNRRSHMMLFQRQFRFVELQ